MNKIIDYCFSSYAGCLTAEHLLCVTASWVKAAAGRFDVVYWNYVSVCYFTQLHGAQSFLKSYQSLS
jgi:hypothetical protein